jgi:hypothetical protein
MFRLCLLACLLAVGAAPAALAAHAVSVLVLLEDPPGWRVASHFAPAVDGTALAARRATIAADRRRAFESAAPPWPARLRAALGDAAVVHAGIECHAVRNACLVHLAAADSSGGRAALEGLAGVSHVSAFPYREARPAGSVTTARIAAPDRPARGLVLAIVDNGADLTQPLLAGALGTPHFQPGTPGEARDGRLLRSHGTAMLGIYAGLARGTGLISDGRPLPGYATLPPLRWEASLIARAGPEDARGQADLVRALAWIAQPTAARPAPDVLNYSQGNGRLCAPGADRRCALAWHGVTRLLDRLVEEYALVAVKSAGNFGHAAETTMTVPGDTYNGITVGNMHAREVARCTGEPGGARPAVYRTSSVAPADGPRLLDLVAPGVRIATAGVDPAWCLARCSTLAGTSCRLCPRLGQAAPDGYWKTNTGTSPAAAAVGATAAALLAKGLRDPRLVKAVLINSANSSAGDGRPAAPGTGHGDACDEHATGQGPSRDPVRYDRRYGWGSLDPAQALAEAPFARLDALPPASAVCYRVALLPEDKLTLVWARRVGTAHRAAVVEATGRAATRSRWYRSSALRLGLYDAIEGDLIAENRPPTAADNVLQVADGGRAPHARVAIVRVSAAAPRFDGTPRQREPYALASARPLTRMRACPPFANVTPRTRDRYVRSGGG